MFDELAIWLFQLLRFFFQDETIICTMAPARPTRWWGEQCLGWGQTGKHDTSVPCPYVLLCISWLGSTVGRPQVWCCV